MRIRMLRSLRQNDRHCQRGEVYDFPTEEAVQLIKAGDAESEFVAPRATPPGVVETREPRVRR